MRKSEKQLPDPAARRRLLKALGGGTAASGIFLPGQWAKPVVDAVLLPAHGQTSEQRPCDIACDFSVQLNWGGTVDYELDLEMETPGGTRIAPKSLNGDLAGQCVQHNGDDDLDGDNAGLESITNIESSLVRQGRYRIFVRDSSPIQHGGVAFIVAANVCGDTQVCPNLVVSQGGVVDVGYVSIQTDGTAVIDLNC